MKRIKSIDPASLGRILGFITFGLTLIWLIPTEFFLLKNLFLSGSKGWGFLFIWLLLIINPGVGYLLGIITAYIYNIGAKLFGGLEIEMEE